MFIFLSKYEDLIAANEIVWNQVHVDSNQNIESIELIIIKHVDNSKQNNHENHPGTTSFKVVESDLAWSAAKLLLMHNINHELVLHQHPSLHVTSTSFCYLTRLYIPDINHPLRCLLDPHFEYTLAITASVLNNSDSILLKHSGTFSPFDINFEEMNTFHLEISHQHLKFNIRNPFTRNKISNLPYSRMMNEYWTIISEWCSKYVDKYIPQIDESIKMWWKQIRRHFGHCHLSPWKTTRIITIALLKRILTSLIFLVSIQHSTDHWLYAQIPVECKPWRWNGPLPENAQDPSTNPELHIYDIFQAGATNHMFFTNVPQICLSKVSYSGFYPMNNEWLFSQLEQVYEKYKLVPSNKISVSIDW